MFHLEIISFPGAISDSGQARSAALTSFRREVTLSLQTKISDSLLSKGNQGRRFGSAEDIIGNCTARTNVENL